MTEIVGLQSIPEDDELLTIPEDEELLSGPAACIRRMSTDFLDSRFSAPSISTAVAAAQGSVPSTGRRSPKSSPVLTSSRKGRKPSHSEKESISLKSALAEAIDSLSTRKCPPTISSQTRTKSRHEYAKWTESLEKSGKRPVGHSVPKNLLKKELCISRVSSCSTADIMRIRRLYMKGHDWMPKSARVELPSPPLEMKSPDSITSPGKREDNRRRSMFTMKVSEAASSAAAVAASIFSPRKSVSAAVSPGSEKSPVEAMSAGPSILPPKPTRSKIRDSFEIDSWDLDDDLPLIDGDASPVISKDALKAREAKEEEAYRKLVGNSQSPSRKTSSASGKTELVEAKPSEPAKSVVEAFLSKSPKGVLDAALHWSKIAPPATFRRRVTSKPLTESVVWDSSFLSNRQVLIAGVLGLYVILVIYYTLLSSKK